MPCFVSFHFVVFTKIYIIKPPFNNMLKINQNNEVEKMTTKNKKYVYVVNMLVNDNVTHAVKIFSTELKAREFCTSFNKAKLTIDLNEAYFSYNKVVLE